MNLHREKERLDFIINRDGLPAAIDFARRTLKNYKVSILRSRKRGFYKNPSHLSLKDFNFRENAIKSCVDFKSFLKVHNEPLK